MEIVKTLHVKFFPFGCREPSRNVTVNKNYARSSAAEARPKFPSPELKRPRLIIEINLS